MEFRLYWKQLIIGDKDLMPELPEHYNWEMLADSMFADIPLFKHMIDKRDLDHKMKGLAKAEKLKLMLE